MTTAHSPGTDLLDTSLRDGGVVVCCDASWEGRHAARAAAATAAGRRRPLTVLAVATPPRASVLNLTDWTRMRQDARDTAAFVVDEVTRTAREHFPDLEVGSLVVDDLSDPRLAQLAADTSLLVLGRRGSGGSLVFGMTTISNRLARIFDCPVLACHDGDGARATVPRGMPAVVAGVRDRDDLHRLLPHALAESTARGWDLRVVHADPVRPFCPPASDAHLREAVEAWLTRVGRPPADPDSAPGVTLTTLPGDPVSALLGAASPGDLLVVGTRGGGTLAGLVPGSVARSLLVAGRHDVMIVRPPGVPARATPLVHTGLTGAPASTT